MGDPGLIPGSRRSSGEGNGNPLQYSRLENPMDRRAWWATVHGVAKSWTRLSDFTFTFFILSGVISPLISSSILGTYWPGEFIFVSYLFSFSYCSWGSQGKHTVVVCHSLLQWTTFCQNSPPSPVSWVAPHGMAHSFIELDKAVVHVISLISFLWLWFSVCLTSDGKG